jgi:hypothetical protein
MSFVPGSPTVTGGHSASATAISWVVSSPTALIFSTLWR